MSKLPGLSVLRSIRGLEEVAFYGPCPTIEKICKADMLKPKGGDVAAGKSKKRKKTDGQERQSKLKKTGHGKAT